MRLRICLTPLVHVPILWHWFSLLSFSLSPSFQPLPSFYFPLSSSSIPRPLMFSFFFIDFLSLSLSLHPSTLRHRASQGGQNTPPPPACLMLGKTISGSELGSTIRWPQFHQHTWKPLSHLFLNSSSSWGCFCKEFPMERDLWVPGEEAASHAQSDQFPGHQQQGQRHHDWPQWRGAALGW